MNKFLDKFGLFDLFSTLIPGIWLSYLIIFLGPSELLSLWNKYGSEKYFIFFVVSFVLGEFLLGLGDYIEKDILDKHLRRNLFDSDIFKNKLFEKKIFDSLVKTIIKKTDLNKFEIIKNKDFSDFIVSYCVSFLELNGANNKEDKMMVKYEMNRSFFLAGIIVIIEQIFIFKEVSICYLVLRIIILMSLSIIFRFRMIRFERYRILVLLRTTYLIISNEKYKK